MKASKSLWAILFLLVTHSARSDDDWISRTKLPSPKVTVLENGLRVAWFPDDRLPLIDLNLLIESGYRDDPQGKTGSAELTSVLLDRGSNGMDSKKFAAEVEKLGASRAISADDDSISIGFHGMSKDSDRLIELLAGMVIKPGFPENEFVSEKKKIIERWQHIGDYSHTLASLILYRALSSNTTYGRSSFASLSEFSKLDRQDIQGFYQNHFSPKNAILLVVGRFDSSQIESKIKEKFSKWNGEKPKHTYVVYKNPEVQISSGTKGFLVNRPGLSQVQIRMGFEGPSIRSPEYFDLMVANALFGEYFNSKLNSEIRDTLGLTYGIESNLTYSKDFSIFAISSSTRNEAAGELITKTFSLYQEFAQGKISSAEVESAKNYLIGGFPISHSTTIAIASRWLNGEIFGFGPEYLNEFIQRVNKVTEKSVIAAVKKHFSNKKPLIAIAGDATQITERLKSAGQWPLKQVQVKDLLK